MAKRFIDTEIWNKKWFREFTPESKCFWFWLSAKCDNAGVLADLDLGLAKYQIGKNKKGEFPTEEDFKPVLDMIIEIDETLSWIPQFVTFQYSELKATCRPHQSVIQKLKERGLYEQYEQYFAKSGRKSNRPSQADQLKEIEDNLKQWKSDWSGVDVGSEFDTLKDWLKQSGKLKKDYSAFFRNWLKKAGGQKKKAVEKSEYLYSCFSHPDYRMISNDPKLLEFCPECKQKLEWTEVVK